MKIKGFDGNFEVDCDKCPVQERFDKLAEYEKTGLTPEQICEMSQMYEELATELGKYKKAEEQGLDCPLYSPKIGANMNAAVRPRGTDSAKVVQVIETKALKGLGTEEDPARIVVQYWSFDGKLLAENDL